MTTTPLVKAEIQRFLSSDDAEVLCVSGKWGVGKTFTWQRLLDGAVSDHSLKLGRYAYVSLFGINSLESLKLSIFENTEFLLQDSKGAVAQAKVFGDKIVQALKKTRDVTAEIPTIGKIIKSAGPLFFSTVRKQLVCIDDLERAGEGLKIKDVLGLISFLKEQRKCKVVFLLNDDELAEQAADFQRYSEKVIDVELKFSPTADDSAQIALPGNDAASNLIADNCRALGISNIRIIKKIERLVRIIEPELAKFNPRVFHQAAHSLTLFGWSKYQANAAPPAPPPLSFLRSKSAYDLRNAQEIPAEEANWNALLDAYSFSTTDEFDLALMAGVQNGFFDPVGVQKAAAELHAKLELANQDSSFEQAWREYHDSFTDNQEEVLDAIYESFKENVQSISTTNFNGTVSLLKDLGRLAQAQELIQFFVQNRNADREFWDLSENSFADNVTDEDVRNALNEKLATFVVDQPTPTAVLMKIGANEGWDNKDIERLASLPVGQYVEIFKTNTGADLRHLIKGALSFDRILNASPTMREITNRAKEALKRIGQESAINARRVRKYGIAVNDDTAHQG